MSHPSGRVSLRTDYHDCYDVWLDRPALGQPCFSRMAADSWSVHRSQMFALFDHLGLPCPAYQQASLFGAAEAIVLYEAPYSHCGEGKRLTTGAEAVATGLGDVFASAFVPDFPGLSYRYFVVAGHGAWFEHWSTEDWRSNCGDGDLAPISGRHGRILNIEAIENACQPLRNPVFAIDFVARKTPNGIQLLAIDWNPAPRLAGTPAHAEMFVRFGSNQGLAEAIAEATLRELARTGLKTLDNNQILLAEGSGEKGFAEVPLIQTDPLHGGDDAK